MASQNAHAHHTQTHGVVKEGSHRHTVFPTCTSFDKSWSSWSSTALPLPGALGHATCKGDVSCRSRSLQDKRWPNWQEDWELLACDAAASGVTSHATSPGEIEVVVLEMAERSLAGEVVDSPGDPTAIGLAATR